MSISSSEDMKKQEAMMMPPEFGYTKIIKPGQNLRIDMTKYPNTQPDEALEYIEVNDEILVKIWRQIQATHGLNVSNPSFERQQPLYLI